MPPTTAVDPSAPAAEEPLGAADFAALMAPLGPFERMPKPAVACSGGPDSLCLTLLAAEWARAHGGDVLALVVDHRLREGSTAEARAVIGQLRGFGVAARLLTWAGPYPTSAVQERAREARYRLLATACREAGILHLLLAHHADDQAETAAMRHARGAGPVGLAGMPAIREIEGLRLLRPLLPVPKARLVATLASRRVAWVEDPSNRLAIFERARLRTDPGFVPARWLAVAAAAGERRRALERRLADSLAEHARPHPLGFLRLAVAALAGADADTGLALLTRLLAAVAGATPPARRGAASRLRDALLAAEHGRWTLAGCVVERRGATVTIAREPRGARATLRLNSGEAVLWDGRFRVEHRSLRPLELARLGRDGRSALPMSLRARLRAEAVPGAAVESLPALRQDGSLVACPPLAWEADHAKPFGARARLTPVRSLAGASFAAPNIVSF